MKPLMINPTQSLISIHRQLAIMISSLKSKLLAMYQFLNSLRNSWHHFMGGQSKKVLSTKIETQLKERAFIKFK